MTTKAKAAGTDLNFETAMDRLEKIVMEFHEYSPGQDHRELVKLLKDHGFEMEIHKNFLEYRFMKYGVLWAWRGKDARGNGAKS